MAKTKEINITIKQIKSFCKRKNIKLELIPDINNVNTIELTFEYKKDKKVWFVLFKNWFKNEVISTNINDIIDDTILTFPLFYHSKLDRIVHIGSESENLEKIIKK